MIAGVTYLLIITMVSVQRSPTLAALDRSASRRVAQSPGIGAGRGGIAAGQADLQRNGQRNGEGSTAGEGTLDLDVSVVLGDNLVGNGQAQAGASVSLAGAEGLENVRQLRRINATAIVLDPDQYLIGCRDKLAGQVDTALAVLDGVQGIGENI